MSKVVCCGLAVMDFVFEVETMPERAEKYRARDAKVIGGGGAANAAVGVARLGGEAVLTARLGRDAIGDMIAADLVAEQVDLSLTHRFENARSAYSSVLVDGAGERQIVNFRGEGFGDAPDLPNISFDAALADTRWKEGSETVMERAKSLGVPGVMDAEAPARGHIPDAATHIAFSVQGLLDFAGESDRNKALMSASEELGRWVCVTDGPAGIFYVKAGHIKNVPSFEVKVVDTLAAGDIWHGAFAMRLGEGADEDHAARFANAAAALKCTGFGGRAATPDRDAVERLLKESD